MKYVNLFITFLLIVTFSMCLKKTFIKPSQEEIDEYLANNPDLIDTLSRPDPGHPLTFENGMKLKTILFLLGEPDTIEFVTQP
jgi:hypothetical protein